MVGTGQVSFAQAQYTVQGNSFKKKIACWNFFLGVSGLESVVPGPKRGGWTEPGKAETPKSSWPGFEIFGDKGKHSRTALGAAALPLNVAVEINLIVEVED